MASSYCFNRCTACNISFLLLLFVFHVAESWGSLGHEIVANLAWRLLSSELQQSIEHILSGNLNLSSTSELDDNDKCPDCSPLARIADWADQVRYQHPYQWSAPLHYIDVRDDLIPGGCHDLSATASSSSSPNSSTLCAFDYTRDCPEDRCVAGAIVNYTHRLCSKQRAPEVEREEQVEVEQALKFLVHFVGDIHQPLHCARLSDRGGNSIQVKWNVSFPKCSNGNSWTKTTISRRESSSFHLRNRFSRRRQRQIITTTTTTIKPPGVQQDMISSGHSHHSVDNLHAVWDDSIIEAALVDKFNHSRANMEDTLFQYIVATATNRGVNNASQEWHTWIACGNGQYRDCTIQWGQESWEYAQRWAYRDVGNFDNQAGTPQEIHNGQVLSCDYYHTRLPIVYERLAVAGVRLAITLASALTVSPSSEGPWEESSPFAAALLQ